MRVLYGDTCLGAPALARLGNSLFIVWTGGGGLGHGPPDRHLNVGFNPGAPNLDRVVLNETSIAGPAMTVFQERLFLAWTGTDGNGLLNVMSSPDGHVWENKVVLDELSMANPALAVFDDSLIIAWTGVDGSGLLNLMSSADGQSFSRKQTLTEHSIDAGPALATMVNFNTGQMTLHLAYTQQDNRGIHEVAFDPPGEAPRITGLRIVNGTSDAGPSLSEGSMLTLGWAGQGVGQLNMSTLDSSLTWKQPRTFGDTSPYAPATDLPDALAAWAGGGGLGGGIPNFQLNVANLDWVSVPID